jgi:hypothetical protein
MHHVLDFRAQLSEAQARVTQAGCSLCGDVDGMRHRPLWMVGKYSMCFSCFEKIERDARERGMKVCPDCHGSALDERGDSGGSCPHCFLGFVPLS